MRKFCLFFAFLIGNVQSATAQEAVDAVQQVTINQLKAENAKLKSDISRLEGLMQDLKFQTFYRCPNPCGGSVDAGNIITTVSTCKYTNFRGFEVTVQCPAAGQVAYR